MTHFQKQTWPPQCLSVHLKTTGFDNVLLAVLGAEFRPQYDAQNYQSLGERLSQISKGHSASRHRVHAACVFSIPEISGTEASSIFV